MTMQWELWDDASGNLLWTYDTEGEALVQVREFVHGKDDVAMIGLSLVQIEAGTGCVVASDEDLATRARIANLS